MGVTKDLILTVPMQWGEALIDVIGVEGESPAEGWSVDDNQEHA